MHTVKAKTENAQDHQERPRNVSHLMVVCSIDAKRKHEDEKRVTLARKMKAFFMPAGNDGAMATPNIK
jgi:hypothetical protein